MKKFYRKTTLMLAALFMQAPMLSAEEMPPIYGFAQEFVPIEDDIVIPSGIYSYSTTEYKRDCVVEMEGELVAKNAVYADGKFYLMLDPEDDGNVTVKVYDADVWTLLNTYSVTGADYTIYSLSWDPVGKKVWGGFLKDGESILGILDLNTLDVTKVKAFDTTKIWYQALAFTSVGELYGIHQVLNSKERVTAQTLVKVSKTDGSETKVKDLARKRGDKTSSACFDAEDKYFYFEGSTADRDLYRISIEPSEEKVTPEMIYVREEQEDVLGIFFKPVAKATAAPEAVTGLSADFVRDSLTGKVYFDSPANNSDGTAGSGEITYTITNGETQVSTGTCGYGQHVETDLTLPAGECTIGVSVANTIGASIPVKLVKWIGEDTPAAVGNPAIAYADGKFTVTWDAAVGVNLGWIDPDKLRYTVTRMPDNVKVAEGLDVTGITDAVAETHRLINYSYRIASVYGGEETASASTSEYPLGAMNTPYFQNFNNSEAAAEDFAVISTGNGKHVWKFEEEAVIGDIDSSNDLDEWLIGPGIRLKGGYSYPFSFAVRTATVDTELKVEALAGTQPEKEALTMRVMEPFTTDSVRMQSVQGVFKPDEDGIYFIAIHNISSPANGYIEVDDYYIGEGVAPAGPEAPAKVEVARDMQGRNMAHVSGVAPLKALDGTRLQENMKIELMAEGRVAATVENVAPGATFEADVDFSGFGLWTVATAARNSVSAGLPVVKIDLFGTSIPELTTGANSRVNDDGTVTLMWNPVTTDIWGYAFNPDLAMFFISQHSKSVAGEVAKDVKGTSYTFTPELGDKQDFYSWSIFSYSTAGETLEIAHSDYITSEQPLGEAYAVPFTQDFDYNKTIWRSHRYGNSSVAWKTGSDLINGVEHDCAYVDYRFPAQSASFVTGAIQLPADGPSELTFLRRDYNVGNNEELRVLVDLMDGNEPEEVALYTYGSSKFPTWYEEIVSLEKYAGKRISLWFKATLHDGNPDIAIADINVIRTSSLASPEASKGVLKACGGEGYAVVTASELPVEIHDLAGNCRYSSVISGTERVALAAGFYIVSAPDHKSVKIVVK